MNREKIGILLVNLGTPDGSDIGSVKRYLIEFLTDGRVIDIPWLSRQLLVRGVIVPFRASNSAKSYQEIWTENGSPLLYYGLRLKEKLQNYYQQYIKDGREYIVELGMRYQNPSIESALLELRRRRVKKIVVVPLFPQYASATGGSVHEKVMSIVRTWWEVPDIQFVNSFYDDAGMVACFAANAEQHHIDSYDHILFSFHGLPQRQLLKGDDCNHCLQTPDCCAVLSEKNHFCYSAQCYATARALAQKLQLPKKKYTVCFQSRLGKDPWLQPYTSEIIENLAKKGNKKLLVLCPAFVADCLETIFEIQTEYDHEFKAAGGEKVQLVESLNDQDAWVAALQQIIAKQLPLV